MGNWEAIGTPEFWMRMVIVLFSIGLHEYGHAKFADMAGDPTPRMMGRVTLNPVKHWDPIGTIFIFFSSLAGYGLGWGKPVLVRPDKMRNPRWDDLVVTAAGPAMNLILAVIFAFAWRLVGPGVDPYVAMFIFLGVTTNVGLMIFNLIPLGPLDGHAIFGAFLPDRQRHAWFQFNRGPGTILFLLLIFLPASVNPLDLIIGPIMTRVAAFFLGIPVP